MEMNLEIRGKLHKILDLCLNINDYSNKEDKPSIALIFNGHHCSVAAFYYRNGIFDREKSKMKEEDIALEAPSRDFDNGLDRMIEGLYEILSERLDEAE